jgi:hypothetical protein
MAACAFGDVCVCTVVWWTHRRTAGALHLPVHADMCWTLVAEEPHRRPILNLEHCPLKANVSCLIFPLHQGKTSSAQPLSGLDSPSQGSRG